MTPQQLIEAYSRKDFLRELHHLFWIEPLMNRGQLDQGWNCKDHALVLAGVASMLGFRATLMFGTACFVQGPTGDSPPLGLKPDPHAWVGIEQLGFVDLSARLSHCSGVEGWRDWEVAGLLGAGFWPRGKAEWQHTLDPTDFENRINAATHKAGINTAVYLGRTFDDLSAREVEGALSYCNSPLTDRLKEKFGAAQELHAKAVLHLEEYLRGAAPTLTDLDQMEAWARLLERPGNAIYRVCTRGKLKAPGGARKEA